MNGELHTGYTLRDILHILFKRKLIIAAFMLGTVVSAGVMLKSYSPRMYEATTQILLSPGREHMLDLTTSSATAVPPRLSFDLDEHTARTIEMLTSKYLSEQLVETLGARTLCEEPVGFPLGLISRHFCDPRQSDEVLNEVVALQVRDNIRAERVGHAALVNLSFRHQDPVIAAKAVNTLGALYLERHLGVLKNARSEAFVQEQAEALKQRLDQAEKNLEDFKRSNGIGSTPKDERESLTRQIALFDVQHAEILAKVAELNGRVARLQTHPPDTPRSGSEVSPAYEKLITLQQKESDMSVRLGERNPDLIALRSEIARARESVIHEQQQQQQIELNGWRARQAVSQPKLHELRARLQALDRAEVDFNHLQQKAQAAQQDYRVYTAKAEESRIANAMDNEKIASVRVIDSARPPLAPLPSTVKLKLILAALFGLLAGVAVSFGLELFRDQLETPDRVERVLGLPVLTSIPELQSKLHE